MTAAVIAFAVGFACGSVPFGWLLGRSRGVDVRRLGSGNIGATNVARTLGWWPGLLTLLADATKGAAPTILAQSTDSLAWSAAPAALGAVCGHIFSPFVGLRGGKGVATAAGAMLVLAPGPTLIAAAVFGLTLYFSGYVSVGSLAAATSLPVLCWLWGTQDNRVAVALLMAALIWFRHQDNLRRLAHGTEPRLSFRRH